MTYKHGFVDDYPYQVGATDPEFAVASSANFAAFKSTVESALTAINGTLADIDDALDGLDERVTALEGSSESSAGGE